MEDEQKLREGVGKCLETIISLLAGQDRLAWTGPDESQSMEFLRRGVITRQREALQTILSMTDAGHGHFGVTLLRPAYEELIWIEYLDQNKAIADELVRLLIRREVAENIEAQNDFVGNDAMLRLGFTQKYVKRTLAALRPDDARLKAIGKQLGWREGALMPSVALLSRKVSREPEYKFLYRATSRYVHFSGQEIYRRIWGTKGNVSISSTTFGRYWTDFALYWGFRLFLELVVHCQSTLHLADPSLEEYEEMMKWLASITPIPIVTIGELESWSK